MDLRTRKTLNRVVFGVAMLFVFVVVGAGGTVGFFLSIPVVAVALVFFLAEELNLRRRTPPPAAPPRPARRATPESWDAPLSREEKRALEEEREEARKKKWQERLGRATEETNRLAGEGVVFSDAEGYAQTLARIDELEEEPWHEWEIEDARKRLRGNIELGEVKREMRRKGELPWMLRVGSGPGARYVEMWTPREELERTFGKEEVSRFVEVDGRLYRPGAERPGSSAF